MTRTLNEFKVLFSKREKEYNEETHNLVYEWGDVVIDEFSESPYAAKLPKVTLRYLYLISLFAEMAYNCHLTTPGNWTEAEIDDVCCYLIPRKLIAPKEAFKQLPKVLNHIFLWGQDVGIFSDTKLWCETLKECKKDIVTNAESPDTWGMAKSFFM